MANVMLTSETAKDPNKPFKLRVEDVCAKFDVCPCVCVVEELQKADLSVGEKERERLTSVLS